MREKETKDRVRSVHIVDIANVCAAWTLNG
jgi:hypothetical protein